MLQHAIPSLVQILACRLVGIKPLSETQSWSTVSWTLRNKSQWSLDRNSYIFIEENAFENVVLKMTAILFHLQCVQSRTRELIQLLHCTKEKLQKMHQWEREYHFIVFILRIISSHHFICYLLTTSHYLQQYLSKFPSMPSLGHLGLYSLSGKTSYRQISRSLEAARLGVIMIVSLWNLTGISAAVLLRCLSNIRAMGNV